MMKGVGTGVSVIRRTGVGVRVGTLAGCKTHPASKKAAKSPDNTRHIRKVIIGRILTSKNTIEPQSISRKTELFG
jgi:hypothetical protein